MEKYVQTKLHINLSRGTKTDNKSTRRKSASILKFLRLLNYTI